MSQRSKLPIWLWFAIALTMLIVGLWLAYYVLVHRPDSLEVLTDATATAISEEVVAQGTLAVNLGTADAEVVSPDVDSADADTGDGMPVTTQEPPMTATQAPPTPTITPTPVPEERLVLGEERLRLGDYAGARTQLISLLASDASTGEQRLRAQFDLAKTTLAEGSAAETLSTLEQLDAAFSADGSLDNSIAQELATKAEYLRAEALFSLGRYDEAAQAYERFQAVYPSTTTTVQPKLGRIYLNRGDIVAGDAAFFAAVDATSDAVHKVLLLEDLASLHTAAGRHANSAAAWDAILDIAQKPNYRALVFNKAAYAYATAGDETTAIARWQSAIDEAQLVYAADDETFSAAIKDAAMNTAYDSLVELVNRQVEFDLFERATIDLEADAYAPAVNAFSAYLDSVDSTDPRVPAAMHGLGQAYMELGRFADAQAVYERVLAEYPDCECFGQVKIDQATLLAYQGDTSSARREYRTFARDYPNDPLAPTAMWRSGLSALNDGLDIEGAADFIALADAFPDSELAPQALFWVGTGAYSNGMYSEAVSVFDRLQRDYPDHRWDAVAYWLGRAQQQQGNTEAANQTWAALVERAPDVYYGLLAAYSKEPIQLTNGSMLTSMGAIAGPASRLEGDDGSQAFADQWMAAWLEVDPAQVAVLPDYVQADADLKTGQLLLDLDARGDALEALERVYERYLDDPQALYALSLEFERLGSYRLSLQAMAHVLALSPANLVEDGPIFMQRRVYPQPFRDLITEQAIAHNIDPLLYFSLIRQESLFEEGARSIAAAQGLAQIIPDTGQWIADQLAYPNYTNDLVYRPVVNVRFGAYYLDWVRDYLDGNIVSALVGYNAGPGNSMSWREQSGEDDVRFVEILGMYEPRIYVKAIASNLYHYYRLYR